MSWYNETYLVGEKVKVEGESEVGVITRVDLERGLIVVMFKRLKEKIYSYPDDITNGKLNPLVAQKISNA